MTNEYVLATNDDGDLAVRTVSATEASGITDTQNVITRTEDGKLAIRTVGGGGDQHNLGYYATQAALEEAHPTAEAGDWAIVGATDTVWIWDDDNSEWVDSDQKGQVTSVNNQTGDVTLTASSIGAVPNTSTDATSIYVYNDTGTGTSKANNFIVTSADFSLSNYSYGNIVLTMTNTLANLNIGSVSEATCVGRNIKVRSHATVFGSSSEAGNRGVAVGYSTKAGAYCIGIGFSARAEGNNCIQLNAGTSGAQNNDANTFKVANDNGNYEIMSADGTIPADRLTHAINKYSTMPTASASNEGWIVQFTGTTDSTYTHGHLYECVSDGADPATYSWTRVDVQPAPSGLPDQTGQSGKFLTTDGTDASWSDKPLVNSTTANNSLQIKRATDNHIISGQLSTSINTTYYNNPTTTHIAIGSSYYPTSPGSDSVAIGGVATGSYSTCIGPSGKASGTQSITIGAINYGATATRAIQIGDGTNSDANTFKVANANGNFEIMSADGTVPTDRLTKVNTTATLAVADWSSNTQTVTVSGVKADSVVFVSPAPASASDYASAGILCTAQAADSLTFTCTTTPTNAITVNVVCM